MAEKTAHIKTNQRITFTRTETVVIEVSSVTGIDRDTARFWATQGYCGQSPLGVPETPIVSRTISDWEPIKSDPAFPIHAEPKSAPKRKR